jgi:hypothetical protein
MLRGVFELMEDPVVVTIYFYAVLLCIALIKKDGEKIIVKLKIFR